MRDAGFALQQIEAGEVRKLEAFMEDQRRVRARERRRCGRT
jgi:hypothetical protein